MAPLTQQQKVANALIEAKGLNYGPRHGDPRQHKGSGFYDLQPRTDGSGQFSTEISAARRQRGIDGPEYPLMYQNMPGADLRLLLGPSSAMSADDNERIDHDAYAAAQGRLSVGLPAFALEGEQSPRSQIGMPPPRYGFRP